MKRFHDNMGALLVCCVTALLLPLIAHSENTAGESGQHVESTQDNAGDMMEKTGDAMSDMRMHMMLETELAQNDNLSAVSIDTDVDNGKAYLTGEVETGAQRELAGELARNIDGIMMVQNDLVAQDAEPGMGEKMSQQASDAALTAKVKSRLLVSDNTSGLAINVDTKKNIVTLEGDVGSETERQLAGLIAGNTAGVEEVRNELKVKPE